MSSLRETEPEDYAASPPCVHDLVVCMCAPTRAYGTTYAFTHARTYWKCDLRMRARAQHLAQHCGCAVLGEGGTDVT
eukprot:2505527-Pyramimonas_sp.AAC.1